MKTRLHSFIKPVPSLFLLLMLCVLLFANMRCKKDKLPINQLPVATQTGANTFGCLVDGEAVTPTIKFIYNNNFNYGYDPSYGLSIEAANEDNKDYLGRVTIQLLIMNLVEGQTYALTDFNVKGKGSGSYSRYYNTGQGTLDYVTNSQFVGSLTITKCDLVKKIISGIFSFKAANTTNSTTINVTDGRFDLTFK